MTKLTNPIRPLLLLAAMTAVALGASACGTTTADVDNGRLLFIEKCGECHTMAEAGASGTIGPSLDASFAGPVLDNVSIAAVPEPSTFALGGIALVTLGLSYARRRRQMADA